MKKGNPKISEFTKVTYTKRMPLPLHPAWDHIKLDCVRYATEAQNFVKDFRTKAEAESFVQDMKDEANSQSTFGWHEEGTLDGEPTIETFATEIKVVVTDAKYVSDRVINYDLYIDGKYYQTYNDVIEVLDAKAKNELHIKLTSK